MISVLKFVSDIFYPTWSILYSYLLLIGYLRAKKKPIGKALFGVSVCLVLGLSLILALRRFASIGDWFTHGLPLVIVAIMFYFWTKSFALKQYTLALLTTNIAWMTMRSFWNISAHATFNNLPAVYFTLFLNKKFCFLIPLSLLVSVSRVFLLEHTWLEVLAGLALSTSIPPLIRYKKKLR